MQRIYFIQLNSEGMPVLKTCLCSSYAVKHGLYFEGQYINSWDMRLTEVKGMELLHSVRADLGISVPRFGDRDRCRLR